MKHASEVHGNIATYVIRAKGWRGMQESDARPFHPVTDAKHFTFQNGSVRLHAVEAGPEHGPVVVLLHGFPESWYGWRKQIGPLARAGFRVVVPDGRGYNLSDKPARIRDYALGRLVADVLALCDFLRCERIFLAGHDWGAAVAWAFAAAHPERVERLAILNAPHPAAMLPFLFSRPRQLFRSWYMFFFQMPRLPERLFRARNFRMGTEALARTARPGTFSQADFEEYRKAWARPGALTGMMNWYRALFRNPTSPRVGSIDVPVLILWGKRDTFLLPQIAERSLRHCRHVRLVWLDEASHWVQHEEAEAVTDHLLQFFV